MNPQSKESRLSRIALRIYCSMFATREGYQYFKGVNGDKYSAAKTAFSAAKAFLAVERDTLKKLKAEDHD